MTRQDSTLPSSTMIVNRSRHLSTSPVTTSAPLRQSVTSGYYFDAASQKSVERLQGYFSDFSTSPVSYTSWSRSLFRTYPKAIFRARARIGPWWGVISDPLNFGPYLWLHVRLESCLPVARTETVCQTDPVVQDFPDYRLKTPRPSVSQTLVWLHRRNDVRFVSIAEEWDALYAPTRCQKLRWMESSSGGAVVLLAQIQRPIKVPDSFSVFKFTLATPARKPRRLSRSPSLIS